VNTETWVVNADVVAEKFDSEIILIDIAKGLYFSLRGSAVPLWDALAVPRKCHSLLGMFGVEVQPSAVYAALGMLEHHGLIVQTVDDPDPQDLAVYTTTPVVEVFSDLSELITIDPVHEVDAATGWPNAYVKP
jgi:hypothetical protein